MPACWRLKGCMRGCTAATAPESVDTCPQEFRVQGKVVVLCSQHYKFPGKHRRYWRSAAPVGTIAAFDRPGLPGWV